MWEKGWLFLRVSPSISPALSHSSLISTLCIWAPVFPLYDKEIAPRRRCDWKRKEGRKEEGGTWLGRAPSQTVEALGFSSISKHTFPSTLCKVYAPRPKAFLFFDSKWHAVNNSLFSCAQAPNSLYKLKKKKKWKKIIWSGSFLQGQNSSLQCDLIHDKVWRRAFVPSAVKDVHILQTSEAQLLSQLYVLSSQCMQVQTLALMDPRGFCAKTQLITGFRELCFLPFLGQHLCWPVAPEKPQPWWPVEMQ